MAPALDVASLGFDPAVLRKKYDEEREKRLLKNGSEQWTLTQGEFKHYIDDPYVKKVERAAVVCDVDVALLGGGFGSLVTGAKLRELGVKSLRVIEEAGGFGGTWYWNRYPNACCDTESYIYLPLLDKTGFMPVEKYTKAPEILAYCDLLARKFDLYDGALFSTHIDELRWNEDAKRWFIRTNRGDLVRAKCVSCSVGNLTRAKLPGINGIAEFKGESFHTSRWNYDYTGGDSSGNLYKLKDKVVGIIGTGATAIQCVPALGQYSKHLYVFQRTPSSVDVRANRPTDPTWWSEYTKQPGWQKRRMESFNTITSGGIDENLVDDGWTSTLQHLLGMKAKFKGSGMKNTEVLELADFSKMEQIRRRCEEVVEDKEVAEKLKPWYGQYCKRPTFSDEYLQTFNRPNVTLVDTDGKGVQQITRNGIMANGVEYPVDLIVFATGFEYGATSPHTYEHRLGMQFIGRGGLHLSQKWHEGSSTLHGITTRGFPNVFFMQSLQSALPFNFCHLLSEQSDYVAWCIGEILKRGIATMEPGEEAENGYVDLIVRLAAVRSSFYKNCTPSYYNAEGEIHKRIARNLPFGGGAPAYFEMLRKWCEDGTMKGMDVTYYAGKESSRL